MRIFALEGSGALGASVAQTLGADLDPHEERSFDWGEHKARPLVSVRGEDVFVIHSLNGDADASANDKLARLLFFIAACKENGAAHVTAVTPYLAYSRKDRQTKARDPVTTRYVAQLFEAMGTDRVITLDVHNIAAFQNAFRCESIHLDARKLFTRAITGLVSGPPVVVVSPDGGGVKRAQLFKELYEAQAGAAAGFAFLEKRRSRGVVSGDLFAGEVKDAAVFIIDDMVGSGGTMLRAARACRDRGAKAVYALATHGLFGPGSEEFLTSLAIDGAMVTDSVAAAAAAARRHPKAKLTVLPVGPIIGEAIRRLSGGGTISDLTGMED